MMLIRHDSQGELQNDTHCRGRRFKFGSHYRFYQDHPNTLHSEEAALARFTKPLGLILGVCLTTWIAFHADFHADASLLKRLCFGLQFCFFTQYVVSLIFEGIDKARARRVERGSHSSQEATLNGSKSGSDDRGSARPRLPA